MFVKLVTDVIGLYILWVSAEMAYNFYNTSAGCPMQIDFNLKHCQNGTPHRRQSFDKSL